MRHAHKYTHSPACICAFAVAELINKQSALERANRPENKRVLEHLSYVKSEHAERQKKRAHAQNLKTVADLQIFTNKEATRQLRLTKWRVSNTAISSVVLLYCCKAVPFSRGAFLKLLLTQYQEHIGPPPGSNRCRTLTQASHVTDLSEHWEHNLHKIFTWLCVTEHKWYKR